MLAAAKLELDHSSIEHLNQASAYSVAVGA
jgi:hypothetical protein